MNAPRIFSRALAISGLVPSLTEMSLEEAARSCSYMEKREAEISLVLGWEKFSILFSFS